MKDKQYIVVVYKKDYDPRNHPYTYVFDAVNLAEAKTLIRQRDLKYYEESGEYADFMN